MEDGGGREEGGGRTERGREEEGGRGRKEEGEVPAVKEETGSIETFCFDWGTITPKLK